MNLSFSDENFVRRIVSPDEVSPDKVSEVIGKSEHELTRNFGIRSSFMMSVDKWV